MLSTHSTPISTFALQKNGGNPYRINNRRNQARKSIYITERDHKKNMVKYNILEGSVFSPRKRGLFIKNYAMNQVVINRESFNPKVAFSIANEVFFRNFSRNPVAVNIKKDLIQEEVTSMFQQPHYLS